MLFIDEIGELHPIQMNKLLKVLEDRKVFLESAYYNSEDRKFRHISTIFFRTGLPADFRLVGATTRSPQEIPPRFARRCMEMYFRPLLPDEIGEIAENAIAEDRLSADAGSGRRREAICHERPGSGQHGAAGGRAWRYRRSATMLTRPTWNGS